MIDSVQLKNYRCFENSTIKFKDISIIVGKNNAGKSSLLEALRLVAMAIRKSCHTTYKQIPKEYGVDPRHKGFRLEVDKLRIDLRSIVFYYKSDVAQVITKLGNGSKVIIYANAENAYALLYDCEERNIKTKSAAESVVIESVDILPQIGLIKEKEQRLTETTIENDKDSYLSSRHFRNEIYNYRNVYWNEFVTLAENTWDGLKIRDISYNFASDESIYFGVSDAGFTAEVGLMGSGLQMWLQIMWFLSRTKESETVILDEPDVYMHPDLQRKLIRIVKERYPQTIIATHSVEIISEVEPKNILTIDKKRRRMSYANDLKAVQQIIDNIGAVNNLSLTRIGNYRKCIFVEGDDIKILAKFADVLYPDRTDSLAILPTISLGGFCNLNETFGAAKLFHSETDGTIECYCILDSDYFPEEQIQEKYEAAEQNYLKLHVWSKKEIENYLLVPNVLFRITKKCEEYRSTFMKELEDMADEFSDEVFDQYGEHIRKHKSGIEHSTANKVARDFMDKNWTSLENKLSLISGKSFIKKLNQWYKDKFRVGCSITKIINNFLPEDIDEEMKKVIHSLI